MKYQTPASCIFFTPEDVIRWALAAYYGASRRLQPPNGESFIEENCPWSSPALFALDVQYAFTESIVSAAVDAKVPCDHGTESASCKWDDSGWPDSHADFCARRQLNKLPGDEPIADTAQHGGLRGV